MRKQGWGVWGVVSIVALAGCASSGSSYPPPSPSQVASTEQSVGAARASGAAEDAQAGRHLTLAEQQLAVARQRMAAGKNRDARWLLVRAEADAELSQVLQQRAHIDEEARKTEAQLRQTRAGSTAPAEEIPPAAPREP